VLIGKNKVTNRKKKVKRLV